MNQPSSRPCSVAGCETSVGLNGARGMCNKHYLRWRTHGDASVVARRGASMPGPLNPNWTGTEASYAASHLRLRRQRGAAKRHACVDCGKAAAHWSYNNADPDERFDPECGRYSPNTSAYDPRCVPCHSAFDRAARNAALLTGERP